MLVDNVCTIQALFVTKPLHYIQFYRQHNHSSYMTFTHYQCIVFVELIRLRLQNTLASTSINIINDAAYSVIYTLNLNTHWCSIRSPLRLVFMIALVHLVPVSAANAMCA